MSWTNPPLRMMPITPKTIAPSVRAVRPFWRNKFLKASFNLQIAIEEQRAPEYIRTAGEGKDSKIAASLKQTNEVTLEAVSPEETRVSILSNVDVFGKLGSLGFSVIKNQANKVFKDFSKNIKAKLE